MGKSKRMKLTLIKKSTGWIATLLTSTEIGATS